LQDSNIGADNARDVTPRPSVGDRLKNKGGRGFSSQHVHNETGGDKKTVDQEKTDPTTGEVTSSDPISTGGAASETASDQGKAPAVASTLADGIESAAAAQHDGKTDESSVNNSETEVQREARVNPPADARTDDESKASDQASSTDDAGARNADASTSPQPDLLSSASSPAAGSKGEPSPGQPEGADGARGNDVPSAPDRLRSYSRALLSVNDGGPPKLAKQAEVWSKKYGTFDGDAEAKRKLIYAAHLDRLTGSADIDATKAKVEGIVGK
jgi:hypothetical protein